MTTSVSSGRPADADDDPVAQRLARVDCRALPGSGVAGRTMLRISMYGWRGARGADLARRVAGLRAQGCRVQALVSAAGPDVVEILLAAGVRVRSASLDVDGNVATGFETSGWEHFVHEKWMSVDGTWDGSATRAVWTGSENWSDVSLLNDELVVMIPRARHPRRLRRALRRRLGRPLQVDGADRRRDVSLVSPTRHPEPTTLSARASSPHGRDRTSGRRRSGRHALPAPVTAGPRVGARA